MKKHIIMLFALIFIVALLAVGAFATDGSITSNKSYYLYQFSDVDDFVLSDESNLLLSKNTFRDTIVEYSTGIVNDYYLSSYTGMDYQNYSVVLVTLSFQLNDPANFKIYFQHEGNSYLILDCMGSFIEINYDSNYSIPDQFLYSNTAVYTLTYYADIVNDVIFIDLCSEDNGVTSHITSSFLLDSSNVVSSVPNYDGLFLYHFYYDTFYDFSINIGVPRILCSSTSFYNFSQLFYERGYFDGENSSYAEGYNSGVAHRDLYYKDYISPETLNSNYVSKEQNNIDKQNSYNEGFAAGSSLGSDGSSNGSYAEGYNAGVAERDLYYKDYISPEILESNYLSYNYVLDNYTSNSDVQSIVQTEKSLSYDEGKSDGYSEGYSDGMLSSSGGNNEYYNLGYSCTWIALQ